MSGKTASIKIVRRLNLTKIDCVNTTYDEHTQIVKAILTKKTTVGQKLSKAHSYITKLD